MIGKGKNIKSLVHASMILDLLSKEGETSLGNIAKKLSLPKTTVHGLITTLKNIQYVGQSTLTRNYRLGPKLFEMGNIFAEKYNDLLKVSAPYIKKLVNDLRETCHLAVLDEGRVLYIDKKECNRSPRIVSEIGSTLPCHCTALGKVLLAYLNKDERDNIVRKKKLKASTKNTITDPISLENELQMIKTQGYAVDNEEIMIGVKCIALPVYDHRNNVIAALSASYPAHRLPNNQLHGHVKKIRKAVLEISNILGYKEEIGYENS